MALARRGDLRYVKWWLSAVFWPSRQNNESCLPHLEGEPDITMCPMLQHKEMRAHILICNAAGEVISKSRACIFKRTIGIEQFSRIPLFSGDHFLKKRYKGSYS